MQEPSIGRTVMVRVHRTEWNNASNEASAVVTCVHGKVEAAGESAEHWLVNVKATLDSDGQDQWMQSVRLFEDEDAAVASGSVWCAWWPARV